MGKGMARASARVSVAVPDEIRREAPKRPELLGLPAGSSRSKVLERLIELGWNAVRRERQEKEQLSLYAAYAQDLEQRAVASADQQEIIRGSVV